MPKFIRIPLRRRWAGAILFITIVWIVVFWGIQQSPSNWLWVFVIGILVTMMMICDCPLRERIDG